MCDYGKEVAAPGVGAALLTAYALSLCADASGRHAGGGAQQRNSEVEKADINAGRVPRKPAKLRQKDQDARWTMKFSKAKPKPDGTRQVDIAIPPSATKTSWSELSHGSIAAAVSPRTGRLQSPHPRHGFQRLGKTTKPLALSERLTISTARPSM